MYPVEINTTRGFRKYMWKVVYMLAEYFLNNKDEIICLISDIKSKKELELFECETFDDIKFMLANTGIPSEYLDSYNRIRKPIDLYIQNIVCMAEELNNKRKDLLPFLFLPLDSSTLKLFSSEELQLCNINKKDPTLCSVKYKPDYDNLQSILESKSTELSKGKEPFYPIYFDLLWGEDKDKGKYARYESWGNNLYETNFGIPL